ncbi:MAG: ABC transporter ATP-binding protein [Gammaproteobacteria bacterium]
MGPLAVETCALGKRYGSRTIVEDLSLRVAPGEFFGLLGRNGSGKTTTLHMLSTLVRPSSGSAAVVGHDVVDAPVAVRRAIGLVFQDSALDRNLTVVENLELAGALYGLAPALVTARSDELIDLFELREARQVPVGQLSGGMRRALDVARGVLHRPQLLLLDEPTLGLDPIHRRSIWRFLARLRAEQGTTLLLTTHYLEEAEDCDRVAFMRAGRVIGTGHPQALTHELGAYVLELTTDRMEASARQLASLFGEVLPLGSHLHARVRDPAFQLNQLPLALQHEARGIQLRRPGLNDVYLWLNRLEPPGEAGDVAGD